MRAERQRLDHALVERGLVDSRSRARALIMAGDVRVDGHVAAKAGIMVAADSKLDLSSPPPFVSRGGEKLAAALDDTDLEVVGRTCLDIGASTGGFTDCLLQRGAEAVISIDVGYGQLDYRLRQDPRVTVIERLNARYLTAADLPGEHAPPTLLVMDVAFIGVTKILPAATAVCAERCDALVLVKPQFECGPSQVGAGGIVASAQVRRETLQDAAAAAAQLGWSVVRAIPSPIRGQAGNWECFLRLHRPPQAEKLTSVADVLDAVEIPEG
jgi:23S rRNA (cytidine1920-2'-O)/16S rRNA (cytidine1409-2'-O)-methyltransferase